MKVSELKQALSTYDDDTEIFALWYTADEFSDAITDDQTWSLDDPNNEVWQNTVAQLQLTDHIDQYVCNEIHTQLQENY